MAIPLTPGLSRSSIIKSPIYPLERPPADGGFCRSDKQLNSERDGDSLLIQFLAELPKSPLSRSHFPLQRD